MSRRSNIRASLIKAVLLGAMAVSTVSACDASDARNDQSPLLLRYNVWRLDATAQDDEVAIVARERDMLYERGEDGSWYLETLTSDDPSMPPGSWRRYDGTTLTTYDPRDNGPRSKEVSTAQLPSDDRWWLPLSGGNVVQRDLSNDLVKSVTTETLSCSQETKAQIECALADAGDSVLVTTTSIWEKDVPIYYRVSAGRHALLVVSALSTERND